MKQYHVVIRGNGTIEEIKESINRILGRFETDKIDRTGTIEDDNVKVTVLDRPVNKL